MEFNSGFKGLSRCNAVRNPAIRMVKW